MTVETIIQSFHKGLLTEQDLVAALPVYREIAKYLKHQTARGFSADLDSALAQAGLLARLRACHQDKVPAQALTKAEIAALVQKLSLRDSDTACQLLDPQLCLQVMTHLKDQVDAHRWQDQALAINYAGTMIYLGEQRQDDSQIALGMMALAEVKSQQRDSLHEAWAMFEEAGQKFLHNGDLLGWSRTRTGLVYICAELGQVDYALDEAQRARKIFEYFDAKSFYIRLAVNLTVLYLNLGQYDHVFEVFSEALPIATALGDQGIRQLISLHNNVGAAHYYRDELEDARHHYLAGKCYSEQVQDQLLIDTFVFNIAGIEQAHGHYSHALHLWPKIIDAFENRDMAVALDGKRDLLDCYFALNRYADARELALDTIKQIKDLDYKHHLAHFLRYQAYAEANLGNHERAELALLQAESYYRALGATNHRMQLELLRARLAIARNDHPAAYVHAQEAAAYFHAHQQPLKAADADLLLAELVLLEGHVSQAAALGQQILLTARRYNAPTLRYEAHYLMGQVAEAQRRPQRAIRHYHAANATLSRLQKNLTITLRPAFMDDRTRASHALIRLALAKGDGEEALNIIEQAKSRTTLGYLANRDRLLWLSNDQNQPLIDELEQQRNRHHRLFRQLDAMTNLQDKAEADNLDTVQAEMVTVERQMRQLTEQLYLSSAETQTYRLVNLPDIAAIRQQLSPDSMLLEFYSDGKHLWLFALDSQDLQVYPLETPLDSISRLIEAYLQNINWAVQERHNATLLDNITRTGIKAATKLYKALIEAVEPRLADKKRLIVVPYAALHYLPFSTLHNGNSFLIEQHEIVMLPAAGLLTQAAVQRPPAALILAHSNQGQLSEVHAEAELLASLVNSSAHLDQDAVRSSLDRPPCQILHIAAHGDYRMHEPELSYIQLEDGQLFTDDLLQCDLSYELVVLSACETGQVNVRPSEDLMGLGWAVLFAGANTVLASLWRVEDNSTRQLMQDFYSALFAGQTKAQALQQAQVRMVQGEPAHRHPAFWGAFHLIGNPEALSQT